MSQTINPANFREGEVWILRARAKLRMFCRGLSSRPLYCCWQCNMPSRVCSHSWPLPADQAATESFWVQRGFSVLNGEKEKVMI